MQVKTGQGKEVKLNQVTAMGGGANLADMANLVADVNWRMLAGGCG